jgi:Transglycosylase SLT domain
MTTSGAPGRPRLRAPVAVALVALAAGGCAHSRSDGPPHPAASVQTRAVTVAPGGASPATSDASGDPGRFAPQVRRYAGQAGIGAELLMAILYNESYKPHDPALERAWQRIDPGAAFGVANMHQDTFDDTKRGRDFAGRDWRELPDDPNLAIEAAAWYLHDLASQLPAVRGTRYTTEELLALGYNAGPGNMQAYARGGRPGPTEQSYLDRLHANRDAAARALR